MGLHNRLRYWRRIFASYVLSPSSQLTFWHETPEVNERFKPGELGEYYMTFSSKADYPGPFDSQGIPILDYHGRIGRQYNPIAVSQYGLANYNRYRQGGEPERRSRFVRVADWLVEHLEPNNFGIPVWNHVFDWEYRSPLIAPWYSGLAQGQGISVLVRAYSDTGEKRYLDAAERAFQSLRMTVPEGGVLVRDERGRTWIEEYLVDPPTHILNGFLWALWGVYDYVLVTEAPAARELFRQSVHTLKEMLPAYDVGYWSLYELSGTRIKMMASPFYHKLHIVQLCVMHRLTGDSIFQETADRWRQYLKRRWNRTRALIQKTIFKILYY